MKLLSVLLSVILVTCEPQLDLPLNERGRENGPSTVKPDILVIPNSYSGKKEEIETKSGTSFDFDRDRDQRFGPPYDSSDEIEYRRLNNEDRRNRFNEFNTNDERYPGTRERVRFPENDDFNIRNQYPPSQYPQNVRDRYGNSPSYPPPDYNIINGFPNPQNQYDLEYERRLRIETEKLRELLIDIDRRYSKECTLNVAAQWSFETNVNEVTQLEALTAQQRYSDFSRSVWEQVKVIDHSSIRDENLLRQVKLLASIGPSALPADQLDRYNRIINDMLTIYNTATVCAYQQPFECSLRLNPQLREIMLKSRDWDELTWVWTEWRRKAGKPTRDLFEQLVDLTNEAARYNNHSNAADYWSSPFDSYHFEYEMESVWNEILPLYELLHSYVRRKLRDFYGPDKINRNAPLPSHILGNMYGQSWNILDITIPYPGRTYLDVTPALRAQAYNPLIMFQLAEEFFTSMNMSAMPPEFWTNSILHEPADHPILCQPSSWDFCNGFDFRIKMCTDVTHKDFITAHHELAHIQYFLNYRHNPKVFRDGANPGFHDAIGDAISLSITPKHLQSLGLIQKSIDDTAHDINFLFSLAMDKLVFLPYALTLEKFRYDVFSKKIDKEEYNCHYWLLREQYSGIKPPVLRSEFDFDPGSKYHIAANVPYLKYFFSGVFQFQLHRSMCRASGEYDPANPSKPLHRCSIYRHPEAGEILKKLMSKGSSQPWQYTFQEVLGEGRLDGSAVREYFRPLEEWLRNENLRTQEYVGWNYDGDYCKRSIETANLQVFGGFYNTATHASINIKISIFFVLLICVLTSLLSFEH